MQRPSIATRPPSHGATGVSSPDESATRPDTLDKSALVLTLCVWAAQFVLLTSHTFLTSGALDDPGRHVARALVSLAAIALCLAMHAVLRWHGEVRPWPLFLKAMLLSLLAGVLLVLINAYALRAFTDYYDRYPQSWMEPAALGWLFLGQLWMLSTWSALYVGATLVIEMQRRDAQLAAAHAAAQQAQLLALRLQINPHFLFNTLNMLAGLIALERKEESERVVMGLSRFLRQTLARTPTHLVPLSDELEVLRMYLDLETARFRDRLSVAYDVADGLDDAAVPSLILLPFAENSVKYALGGNEGPVRITVCARRERGMLLLQLDDDGGAQANHDVGLGIGLRNVRQQLQALYGDAARMRCGRSGQGWRNRVWLPLTRVPG